MNSSRAPETNGKTKDLPGLSRLKVFALAALVAVGLLIIGGLTVSASTFSATSSLQEGPTPTPTFITPLIVPGGQSGVLITDLALPDSAFVLHWFAPNSDPSRAVAWGDVDNDGDLDLAVANWGKPNRVYINNNGVLDTDPRHVWQSSDPAEKDDFTTSLAWGDVNGDGYLDLVVGNEPSCPEASRFISPEIAKFFPRTRAAQAGLCSGGANRLYLYDKTLGTLSTSANWSSTEREKTRSIALGDIDGDGSLDLAVGNYGAPNRVYVNSGGALGAQFRDAWQSNDPSEETDLTTGLALGDVNSDGQLDLVVGNEAGPARLYLNTNGRLNSSADWSSPGKLDVNALALADTDEDGALDLVMVTAEQRIELYLNEGGTFGDQSVVGPRVTGYPISLALGDYDGNGQKDIAVGKSCTLSPDDCSIEVFLVVGGKIEEKPLWTSPDGLTAAGLAWGDIDGDGGLDLAAGVGYDLSQPNRIYRNNGFVLTTGKKLLNDPGQATPKYTTYAWGDLDGDGFMDLAAGSNEGAVVVYRNEDGVLASQPAWRVSGANDISSLAWGDVNGDGLLDLAVGNQGGRNQVFLNTGSMLDRTPAWETAENDNTAELAWGDLDGNGQLDLAVANAANCSQNASEEPVCSFTPERVYYNIGSNLPVTTTAGVSATWSSTIVDDATGSLLAGGSTSLALGDVDNDGDLDLAVGRRGQANVLYLNNRGRLGSVPAWQSDEEELTSSVAFGDVTGDGYLDLIVGNTEEASRLYQNNHGQLATSFTWSALDAGTTSRVALSDIDGDADLDLVVNDQKVLRVYRNEGGALTGASVWTAELPLCKTPSSEATGCTPLALVDTNNDGDMDVTVGGVLFANLHSERLAAAGVPTLFVQRPTVTGPADFYSAPEIVSGAQVLTHTVISFTYALSQSLPATVTLVGEYSLNGPGNWQPATGEMAADRQTFLWDTAADGLMGRSDNTVFRLKAVTTPATGADHLPNLHQYGADSAATLSFRAQGTQVKVVDQETGDPMPMAVVYRLPKGEVSGAQPLGTATTQFRTDENGYLQGSGTIDVGDQLFALAPVPGKLATPDDKYTLYYTNLTPTANGASGHVVTEPGLQRLEVSKDQPLVAFNLDVSLEWDARNDGTFLADLEQAIKQSSEILFDVSNGQMALGNVRVFEGKANWLTSDIVVYANNSMRPRATMGGVLTQTLILTDTIPASNSISATRVITEEFRPGRIRIGPIWDPYGESRAELQQDWWRALAHEYGHYLLYLPDNYLGRDPTKAIVNCVGSFMTTAYDDKYSEFLDAAKWANPASGCADTIAAATTGRSDWETVNKFYPMVFEDAASRLSAASSDSATSPPLTTTAPSLAASRPITSVAVNNGPSTIPLDITRLYYRRPAIEGVPTIPARNFDLREEKTNNRIVVPQGQAFLIKTQGTAALQDDVIIALGQTGNSGSIKVRGASEGDKVCVVDTSGDQALVGCNPWIRANSPVITMHRYEDWGPDIKIDQVSQLAMVMTVTQSVDSTAPVVEVTKLMGDSPVVTSTSQPNLDGYQPVTLVSQANGPMFALAVTQTVTNPVPLLWIRQISGPSVAVSVTQQLTAGQPAVIEIYRPAVRISATQAPPTDGTPDTMRLQLYPGYFIPNRNYIYSGPNGDHLVFSPAGKAAKSDTITNTFTITFPVDYPVFSGFVSASGSSYRTAVSQFFLAKELSPGGGVRWGGVDGYQMGVDNRRGLGPADRSSQFYAWAARRADKSTDQLPDFGLAYYTGLGPNDLYGLGPNDLYGLGPNDLYGLGPNDLYGLGPNDLYGLGPNDLYGLGPNDLYGLGPDDLFGLGPNDLYGLGPNDLYGLGPNDLYGLGPNDLYGLGPNDLYGLGPNDLYGLGPNDLYGLGPNDLYGLGPNDLYGLGADLPGLDSAWSTAGAPISSEDGQVAVYNRGDILGDPGTLSLQALAKPPGLPDWLTTVGRAYRFEAKGTQERVMAFHYLRREIPAGYEHTINVYYSSDDGKTWQRLPTELYPDQNLATVAADNSGIYALAAAVDVPLYTKGWNLFSYPIANSRPITEVLRSLPADSYGTIFGYDSEDLSDPWKVYSPTVGMEWVNDLSQLEFGESYWISVTMPTTDQPLLLQIEVAEGQAQTFPTNTVSANTTPIFQRTPPAVYYGALVNAPTGIAVGATVDARVGESICGSGVVSADQDGNLRYTVKVEAADVGGNAGCGAPTRDVTFNVGGRDVPGTIKWDNNKLRKHDLEFPSGG